MNSDLLIVEDLLLLLLDDKTGTIAGEGTLFYTLGGAVLAELDLRGAVETDDSRTMFNGLKVHAVPGASPDDPMLLTAYEKVAKKTRGAQELLIDIGADLRGQVVDRLVERGFITRETKRTLGIFRTTTLPAARPEYEADLLEGVRAALEDGVQKDARTAAIAALLSASGTVPQLHPAIRWSAAVYTNGKNLEAAHWAAAAVDAAVIRTSTGIAASTAASL